MGSGPATGAAPPRGGTPQRTCIGCRRVGPPAGMERVARRPDGSVTVGRTEPGRGAWLCAGSASCFELAVRRRAFGRALRRGLSSEEIDHLRGKLVIGVSPRGPEDAPTGASGHAPSSL